MTEGVVAVVIVIIETVLLVVLVLIVVVIVNVGIPQLHLDPLPAQPTPLHLQPSTLLALTPHTPHPTTTPPHPDNLTGKPHTDGRAEARLERQEGHRRVVLLARGAVWMAENRRHPDLEGSDHS